MHTCTHKNTHIHPGTYLPANPALTGEGTKKINLIGDPFVHPLTDETNLGGIPGDAPANILPGY